MASPHLFSSALRRLAPPGLPAPVAGALDRLLHLDQVDALYASAASKSAPSSFPELLLSRLNIHLHVNGADLDRIPRSGPAVVVANHPFGLIDGIAASALLSRVRPDVKFLANPILGAIPEMRDRLILIDPFADPSARLTNPRGLRAALAWLQHGGLLVVFPAGEVAHLDFRRIGVQDPSWHPTAARLVRKTGAAAIPLFFSGKNSALFQVAGLVHPRLRTALLPRELWNKRGSRVEARIGHPIPASRLDPDPVRATSELRSRVDWLAQRSPIPPSPAQGHPIAPTIPPDRITTEIVNLPPERLLTQQGPWQVWQLDHALAPLSIREIGRLREITFRAAGEGTGLSSDLDPFDHHYHHLVLWNSSLSQIAGAYRLCPSDHPSGHLYTQSLFRFHPSFWDHLGPALELGRSFIHPNHQRAFQPLYLLWRAIGAFIRRHPRYLTLFGPVSISSHYQPASRALLAQWLRQETLHPTLAPLVQPKRPWSGLKLSLPSPRSLDQLEDCLRDIEPHSAGVPVLLRHYLRLGGRVAALHLDQNFNSSLDALIVVDLRQSDRRSLARYFGDAGAAALFGHAYR